MDTATKKETREGDVMIINRPLPAIFYPVSYTGRRGYLFFKRVFDVLISSILILVVLSWLYPLLTLLIRLSSKGGALFIQRRVGLNGKEFKCLKFRTMVVNKSSDWMDASLDDKRITKIGRLLRSTYIDELPQLINVLIGDMSIVGPRPHMLYHHQKFCKEVLHYDRRHWLRPGITGLSQVKGYHGWISSRYHIYCRTKLDLFYVQKASFKLDVMILVKTISILFSFNKNIKR